MTLLRLDSVMAVRFVRDPTLAKSRVCRRLDLPASRASFSSEPLHSRLSDALRQRCRRPCARPCSCDSNTGRHAHGASPARLASSATMCHLADFCYMGEPVRVRWLQHRARPEWGSEGTHASSELGCLARDAAGRRAFCRGHRRSSPPQRLRVGLVPPTSRARDGTRHRCPPRLRHERAGRRRAGRGGGRRRATSANRFLNRQRTRPERWRRRRHLDRRGDRRGAR